MTHYLYGGEWENRLKQEILLGIGGVRALQSLHIARKTFPIATRVMRHFSGWSASATWCCAAA